MKITTENIVKGALAILLLICLMDMPYGYYQLIRFVAVVGFAILGYFAYEGKNTQVTIVFVVLAFLYQPLLKVSLGRDIWMVVDAVVAAGLIISVFAGRKKTG
ncbi:MAG: DUF6804 family protein [Bacteroidota bacterium]